MSPTSPRRPGVARQQAAASVKVHRDSRLVHKAAGASPSSSTNSSVSVSSSSPGKNGSAGGQRPAPRQKAQQPPVIIYTHSPKVIRTSPRDFMSIVQKLTGLESAAVQDDSSSSSNESCAHAPPPHYMDPHLQMPPLDAHFMPDIPLFSERLLVGSSLYGHQFPPPTAVDAAASLGTTVNTHSGGAGAVFPPSILELEAMRTTFPDYQLT